MKLPELAPSSEAGRAALERLAATAPPTAELEEWRYSRIDEIELPGVVGDATIGAASSMRVPEWAAGMTVLAIADGLPGGSVDLPDGVTLGAGPCPIDAGADWYTDLNIAGAEPLVLGVAAGADVDVPIVVVIDGSGLAMSRLAVRVGANSRVELVEIILGRPGALMVPVTTIDVGDGANVRHMSVQEADPGANVIGRHIVDVGRDGHIEMVHASFGGDYGRLRFDCNLRGRGAHGSLSAVYFGTGDQQLDLRTFQRHLAPDTTSALDFKGAVAGRGHSVYTGLIHIDEDAPRVAAAQSNRVIQLSEESNVESVPNLEIHNNDVSCSHASAVGPIDPDQRFYLESRGIDPETAERLVVRGFLRDGMDTFTVEPLRHHVAARVEREVDEMVIDAVTS